MTGRFIFAPGTSAPPPSIPTYGWVAHFCDFSAPTVRPATVAKHYRSLQQLFRSLVDDGESERSPMERMRPPAVPEQPVPIVTDVHLEALLATCKGNTFENRRDLAILRLFLDTGMRAGELVDLHVDDLDQEESTALRAGEGRAASSLPVRREDGGRLASLCPRPVGSQPSPTVPAPRPVATVPARPTSEHGLNTDGAPSVTAVVHSRS